MASNDQDDLRARFTEITGIEGERSRFYLEAAAWNLDTAVASFYEGGHDEDIEVLEAGMDADDQGGADSTRSRHGLMSALLSDTSSGERFQVQDFPQAVQDDGSRFRRAQAPRAGQPNTLDSLRGDDSSDDERQGEAFYAGGSQSSGQQVLGPPKKRDELVAEMFKKARELGAEEVPAGHAAAKNKASSKFGGTGYKLGENAEDSVVIPSSDLPRHSGEPREFVLRLWSNGFTVNDGPLRDFYDPANMEFLEAIKRREIPAELRSAARGQEVDLTMEDHRREEYTPPKVSSKPFSGKGQTLGSPAPATIGSTAPASETDKKANETVAQSQISLVESDPTTNITFRLVDGSRLQARFNHTHTVNDLYQFVNTARPQMASTNYVLTFFPNKELTERSATVKEANVLNAMITQKLKN